MQVVSFYKNECRSSLYTFTVVIMRSALFKILFNKNIIPHNKVIIKGIKNININGNLKLGLFNTGFVHRNDTTLLNIVGKLVIKGNYSIGRGCRIDIGKEGIIDIKGEGFVNANTQMVIMHSLVIGKDCVISWNCQFLDENFHKLHYDGKKEHVKEGIELGNHVWVGCNVKIYGSSIIPNGCVIAADSVVKNVFLEENCLIAGSPAQIVKRNISWEH